MLKQPAPIDLKALLGLAALFVATWLLWDTPLVYPIKIFVVMLHELGHAIAALVTGGQVVGIQIFPEEGGVTFTRGGWPFIILSAGYLGSLLAGSVLLYLSNQRRGGRGLMIALSILIAASTLLFVRNVFGVIYGPLAAAALWFSAYRLPTRVNLYIVRFIAVACCLYALLDIRSDLFTFAPASGAVVNDAVALSRLTGVPALVWSMLWLIVSLWVLATFLKSALTD
ncbi:MAG: M50 family metallopeptidase [Thermoflexales bacterium]|nr:M50 family metallopeptidase [Thermoflexales bacterium]